MRAVCGLLRLHHGRECTCSCCPPEFSASSKAHPRCCPCAQILGPILMLVGMNYLGDSTTDSRGALIQRFNTKVQAWNDGEREAMAGLTLTVGGGAGRQRPLAEVELEGVLRESVSASL